MHTRTHAHNHLFTHTTVPLPSPRQQTRQYIQGNTESVPSEIHRILLSEAVIGNGPPSTFRWRPVTFGFCLRGRGEPRSPLRRTPGVSGRRVEIVIEAAEAFVHTLIIALVGGGVHLVLSGRDLQRTIPHAIAKVDEHT